MRRAGTRTAILAPGELGAPQDLLEAFDGLLLVGGGDVDPAAYGAEPDLEHNYGVEPDRDRFEIELLLAADRVALPTLCICRGMQVMNVAFGGTLIQHLPDVPDLLEHGVPTAGTSTIHEVAPEPGIDRVGGELAVTGRSPDGLVEAVERIVPDQQDESASWMVGVQWHPEETAPEDPVQQSLFDALALLARLRGSRAKPGEARGRSREYGLAPSDPGWPVMFESEAQRIRRTLGDLVDRIDHVGSTSVPGLDAKPIVDIQLSLASMIPRQAYVEPLTHLGYRWVVDPWTDEHEYFSRNQDGSRAFQIHVCRSGSEWERRHLAFRDWLREHPDDAAEYARLKHDLAERHPRDIIAYVEGKGPFIKRIESVALAAAATGR
jgi:GrpB-like predicted nucleotidyltransferase (UPF0157 family)